MVGMIFLDDFLSYGTEFESLSKFEVISFTDGDFRVVNVRLDGFWDFSRLQRLMLI